MPVAEKAGVIGAVFPNTDGATNGEAGLLSAVACDADPPMGWMSPPLRRASLATIGERATFLWFGKQRGGANGGERLHDGPPQELSSGEVPGNGLTGWESFRSR